MKFLKLRNCNVEVKPTTTQLIIKSEIQDEMDMISSKHSEKEFGNIILKKEEDLKNSINSDVIHEPCAGGDNIAICKSEEETQDEMDMISSKHSEKEFGNIILKKEEDLKNSIDSDVIQEPCAGGDNIAICKSEEETQDEMDMISSKHSEKEFGNIILKKEEDSKTSIDSDVIQEPCAGGDNIAICKSEEEASDEFERLADSWTDEETQADT